MRRVRFVTIWIFIWTLNIAAPSSFAIAMMMMIDDRALRFG
jgi:hypothetical protein